MSMTARVLQQQELFAEGRVDRPRVDDPWFYRGEARFLGVDPQTKAERYARDKYVLERFRSAEDRAGERDGIPVNTNGIKRRMQIHDVEARPTPEEKIRAHKLAHHNPEDMAPMNGLWRNVGASKDHRGRLSVDAVCTGPNCSGMAPARTRKFAAHEWLSRQTSCFGCTTYRRREERLRKDSRK